MSVALVLDFPGGTREQYDEVVKRMQLGGRMAPGGLVHVAGSYSGGWRVIDVWETREHFERFRDEQIAPHTQAVGMRPPEVRAVQVDETKPGNGERAELVQCVLLPGLDHDAFQASDDQILPGGEPPSEVTFHVNGPVEDGWCVIDGWTSKEARDRFIETRVKPALDQAPMHGPPVIEDLIVQATLAAGATVTA